MFQIVKKEFLNPATVQISVAAPAVARKVKAGQFVILRHGEFGERIPLTVSSADVAAGTITLIYQTVGKTTMVLSTLNEGDYIDDVAGPLGRPTDIEGVSSAAVVGGGLGCAIALPVAASLKKSGARVDMIAGFRNKDIIIVEDEMKAASENLYICTDDGSAGFKGLVTEKLKELIEGGAKYDRVYAIGPLVMMKFVCELTKKYGVDTVVSMNPIMIDGTGMCGCCRVTVGGKVRFACVEGPDFNGHEVDFDETISRNKSYRAFETEKREECNLLKAGER